MNLLILLSALLSALTGIGSAVRRPEVAQAVAARSVAVQPARAAAALIAQRPVVPLPKLVASAAMEAAVAFVRVVSIDFWANRRRE
ncbi:hypothetical protein [Sphingomonas bacterium]|uniref:hypothetical protein n=1 Tax=Sphingomonas bacterium TaxID=1895847 RepID=UPI00157760F4|nr:hypothetical protein [Sphingomonas bacterium]